MSILVTGGAGFIGSHLVEYLLRQGETVAVLDKFTYAGNTGNLVECVKSPKFSLCRGDICNQELLEHIMFESDVDRIIHLAAETHVDRSIDDASQFLRTNIIGTHTLLEVARKFNVGRFLLVSTDEVYGEVLHGEATESSGIKPRNPYSASKAAQEHLVYSYWNTHKTPTVIVRGCNNYGPRQHAEKFIPTVILNALQGKPIPIYGDGLQEREWMYVEDFARGIATVLEKGELGEVYNVGSGERLNNRFLALLIANAVKPQVGEELMRFVKDRPGHDVRYAVNSDKIKSLGWSPQMPLEKGIKKTIDWYKNNLGS